MGDTTAAADVMVEVTVGDLAMLVGASLLAVGECDDLDVSGITAAAQRVIGTLAALDVDWENDL